MAEGGGDNAVPKQESAAINIVVRDQAGNEVHFKIKTHTKFEKVFNAYCDKKGQDPRAVKFLFDGQRVEPSSTPATHEMEDGDIIDCMIEQIGGAHGPPMLQGRRSKGISPGSA
ncbi:ubiquitin-related domain-containing protein [Haematococcus lacustris]